MAGMTLDRLRIFLAVAEHQHFSRAAETLYITQPAVSAAIQSLEEQYGVKLFHRIGRHIEIAISQFHIILVLNSGEMVKSIVESGVGAAAISELMVKKELQLGTLRAIPVKDDSNGSSVALEIVRPFLKLKHRQRFQTRPSRAFEAILAADFEEAYREIVKKLPPPPATAVSVTARSRG